MMHALPSSVLIEVRTPNSDILVSAGMTAVTSKRAARTPGGKSGRINGREFDRGVCLCHRVFDYEGMAPKHVSHW